MFKRNICDVQVDFPYEPYTIQLSMMMRIVSSLNNKQNCLLESPTGTGKTMAMLCPALAWLEKRQKDIVKQKNSNPNNEDNKDVMTMPKIFFGTRTHKQIGQVVREMSRSSYKDIPMTILSSRKQSCVNNQILMKPDINEACRDACKNKECSFKRTPTPMPNGTWDMESMKVELKKSLLCPYYQSRGWMKNASIIFCPYNYILDPSIRQSMCINLKDAIVILDEGHNIEDICREGASAEITLENLNSYKEQCLKLHKNPMAVHNAIKLIELINDLAGFIEILSSRLVFVNEEVLKKTWDSRDVVKIMTTHNLDLECIEKHKANIEELVEMIKKEEAAEENRDYPKISLTILTILLSLLTILKYILKEPCDSQSDFRVVLTENGTFIDVLQEKERMPFDSFMSTHSRKRKNQEAKPNYMLGILCMNPGLVFKDISSITHSIILASGTLAPLSSFQRELCCTFGTSLEAGHVAKPCQTMIASVSCGPKGVKLNATYKNIDTYAFQDELGGLLLGCCKSVPHGVLCFFSSFQLIDKLFDRWKVTKLIDEIQQHKTIIVEPRNSADMHRCMEDYYRYIEKGVIMLAVYRGKASEGMDFSDDAARLVICVGIPFPTFVDFKVTLKKEYNDIRCKASKEKNQYLSGREWYSIQGFRALNQAIGRCIRHRDDWGAMIFVDERFESEYYNQGLCKWIRMRKNHYNIWPEFISSLEDFIELHMDRRKKVVEDIK